MFALGQADAAEADAEGIAFFEKNIRPVLANNCYRCHSTEARNLKEALAEQMLENGHLIKSTIGDGGDEE